MKNENDIKKIVQKAIEPKLQEQFYNGLMAGWSACTESLYKQACQLNTAKEIKKMLKVEKEKRHIKTTEDSD